MVSTIESHDERQIRKAIEMGINYRAEVMRTANTHELALRDKLALGGMGLAGESGEVVDLLKKHLFHDKPLDREKIIKELGDVYWYLEYLMIALQTDEAEVKAANVAKLRARFPNGFNAADAARKADES